MSDISQGLESLGEITGRQPGTGTEHIAISREKKVDKFGRAYATGKRKNAVARVWVKPGKGNITINGKTITFQTGAAALAGSGSTWHVSPRTRNRPAAESLVGAPTSHRSSGASANTPYSAPLALIRP